MSQLLLFAHIFLEIPFWELHSKHTHTPLFFFQVFDQFPQPLFHTLSRLMYIRPKQTRIIICLLQKSFWLAPLSLRCFNKIPIPPDSIYSRKMTLSAISINGFKQSGENFLANQCEYILFDSRSSCEIWGGS